MAVDKEIPRGRSRCAALLARAVSAAADIGATALLVHAIDREAAPFYVQYGFQAFPEGTLTLFLPIATIVPAL
jgi:N-acetylglutamate synthase-like GNAT family acetyltransferase